MRTLSALLFSFVLHGSCLAQEGPRTFYLQLIRGTDQDQPQQPSWKPVGDKLSRQFVPRFRWKTYWEIARTNATVEPGHMAHVRLSADREVEIDLRKPAEPEIRLYTQGVLSRKCRDSLKTGMCIMGGTRDNDESWFVVIRRDPPAL